MSIERGTVSIVDHNEEAKWIKFQIAEKEINGIADPEPREVTLTFDEILALQTLDLADVKDHHQLDDPDSSYAFFAVFGLMIAWQLRKNYEGIWEGSSVNINGPYLVLGNKAD